MIAAYLNAMRNYASFNGRASRSEYWWYLLTFSILYLAALGVDDALFGGLSNGVAPVLGLVLVIHALPGLALVVRRLHDNDRSAWFILIELVPLVGAVVLIIWFCQRGTVGPNRFGPDPLGDGTAVLSGATLVRSPTRARSPLAAAVRDVVAEVERLAHLRASGSLSETEFAALKAQVMAGRV